MAPDKTCIIGGAGTQLAPWLIPELLRRGWKLRLLSRGIAQRHQYGPDALWQDFDFKKSEPLPTGPAQTLIHIADINLVIPHLRSFRDAGVKRVVAFSSTSKLTKVRSSSPFDQATVARLQRAEDELMSGCAALGMDWTILRPTLIYGGLKPKGVVVQCAQIIRLTRGWFPIVGDASGFRQPVHTADLAMAAIQAAESPNARNRAFNLSGGEKLTFRQMIERIFTVMGRKPRFVRIPVVGFQAAIAVISCLPRYSHFSKDTALRMMQDMSFDHAEATAAFGYSPISFIPLQPYPDRRSDLPVPALDSGSSADRRATTAHN
jgi:nucleoside-diphosphate-sugar epimerase